MGAHNKYLDKFIPALYKRQAMDIMIFMFIDTQRYTIPGISVENAALAFMKKYGIDEEDLTLSKIISTFFRIQNELIDEQRTKTTRS